MKIKTSEWLGCEFGARISPLRKKVELSLLNGLFDFKGIDADVSVGVLSALRLEFIQRVCAFAPWKHYIITPQAQKMADSLKIDNRFDYAFLRRLRPQQSVYMTSPDEFYRFYNDEIGLVIMHMRNNEGGESVNRHCFQITYDEGLQAADEERQELADRLLRLLVFVELSDPEILLVESGKESPNRKAPLADRIENKTDVAITRVHSHWNKFVINTSLIGVKPHFRLQACGVGHLDRKLIVVQAHTRNGYIRNPKT